MSQGFGRTKRRIEQAKRQKREDKRLRRQTKDTPSPANPAAVISDPAHADSSELLPVEIIAQP